MTHDPSWLDAASAYALGALDPAARPEFEAHLRSCAVCRAEVESLQPAVEALALAASPVAPPASVRARVLREAASVRTGGATASGSTSAEAEVVPIATRRASGAAGAPSGGRAGWYAAIAASLVAAGFANAWWQGRTAQHALLASRDALRDSVRQREVAIAERDSMLASLVAPDLRTASLASTGQPPSARLFWDPSRRRIILTARDLRPAPAGRTYQLWGLDGTGAPVSLGTFNADASGRATVVLAVEEGRRFALSAVTEEPEGGSPGPTTTPFLVGNWRAGE